MESSNVQIRFFQHIRAQLPPHIAIVDEVAELLGISNDSAYRRIRGEKPIDLEETYKLCNHFKMSMDQLLHLQSDAFIFNGSLATGSDSFYEIWLNKLFKDLTVMHTFEQKHLYYLTKDIPFIAFFQIPELASFKSFFWMKSILHYEGFRGKKFALKNSNNEFEDIHKKIVALYNQIPATEIWNTESVNTTIRQIEFYRDSNIFESKDDATILYEKLEELLRHFEKQAEIGKKFTVGQTVKPTDASFQMFNNEVVIGDNTCLADLGKLKITYLNHSVMNFITTSDARFNQYMYESIMNLIRKSTQISDVGEKDRSRFFENLRGEINARKNKVLR